MSEFLIDASEVAHGLFNAAVALLFFYQAWMGLKIRIGRKKGEPQFVAMRRHRKLGPFLVITGIIGYCAGLILVYIDKGRVLEYPLHLAVGSLIVLFLFVQYAMSKKIMGPESSWRTPHFTVGLAILCLYVLQAIIGLAVLF